MRRILAALLAISLVVVACSSPDVITGGEEEPASDVSLEQVDSPAPRSELAEVIEKALPSVVNVQVESIVCDVSGPIEGSGQGSGVVIDRRGIVLTNYHVIAGAVDVEVVFNDDRGSVSGTVIGEDPDKDLAVVRVDGNDLDPIEIGRSSDLRLGDDVVAIGFPLGLGGGPTVTKGIVSATDRAITAEGAVGGAEELGGLLQTDAAINPGNSGGALIDAGGRLVGINTAAAQAAAAENVGFAIAIDQALPVVREILSEPPEKRAWLGVTIDSVTSEAEALRLGLDGDVRGALVVGVVSGSPAEDANLEIGEVVTAIDDKALTTAEDLTEVLATYDPGDEVTLSLASIAGGRTVTATLAPRPETCG